MNLHTLFWENRLIITISSLIISAGILAGCSAVQQAKVDYDLGKETPVAADEKAPEEAAKEITDLVSAIPGVGPLAPFFAPLLVGIARINRGRRIRKGLPHHPNPITGNLGKNLGVESVVQGLATFRTAMMELGPDDSGLKRAWKMGAASLLAIGTVALTIPSFREYVVANPVIAGIVALISAVFGWLDKDLKKVLPLVEEPTPPNV